MSVKIQNEDFNPQYVVDALCEGRADNGAVATFVGLERDSAQSESISAMGLERCPGMTEKALQEFVDQAHQHLQLQGVSIIHRVGKLQPAEQIVMVAVASPHWGEV